MVKEIYKYKCIMNKYPCDPRIHLSHTHRCVLKVVKKKLEK